MFVKILKMEKLFIFSLLCVGITSFLIHYKVQEKFYGLFLYLFFVVTSVYSLEGFKINEEGISLVSFIILYVSIHLVIHQFIQKKQLEIASLLSLGFFFLFYNSKIEFQAYSMYFDFKNMLILPFLATIFPFAINLKTKWFGKFLNQSNLIESFHLMGIGFLVFFTLFFGNSFGLLLVAASYFVAELHLNKFKETKTYYSFYLFTLSFLLILINQSEIDLNSLTQKSTLFGLFLGAGIAIWINKFKNLEQLSVLKRITYVLLPLLLISMAIFVELIKEHTGGLTSFSGIIIGFVLRDKQIHKTISLSVLSISFALILIAIPLLKPIKIEIKNDKIEALKTNNSQETESSAFELPGKKAKEIIGKWKIVSSKSKINFELGPKETRTKGIFKQIEGKFKIKENIENSLVEINLPLESFSTFNSFRDEALMEEAFFDAKKYPILKFSTTNFIEMGDKYILEGTFFMKGLIQKIEVELKIIALDKDNLGEFALIVGKSSIDRTKHKMQSDPKIGDIVDFTFELELRK